MHNRLTYLAPWAARAARGVGGGVSGKGMKTSKVCKDKMLCLLFLASHFDNARDAAEDTAGDVLLADLIQAHLCHLCGSIVPELLASHLLTNACRYVT